MRALLLKAGTTALTLATTAASAFFVTSHLKNAAAPLQPPVLTAINGTSVAVPGGSITVGSAVQSSDVQPVTSTYAS